MLKRIAAERALRGIALGRKSWLFAGSDRGGERWQANGAIGPAGCRPRGTRRIDDCCRSSERDGFHLGH